MELQVLLFLFSVWMLINFKIIALLKHMSNTSGLFKYCFRPFKVCPWLQDILQAPYNLRMSLNLFLDYSPEEFHTRYPVPLMLFWFLKLFRHHRPPKCCNTILSPLFCLSNVNLIFMSQDLSHFSYETFSEVSDQLSCPITNSLKKEYMFHYNIYILILISEFILF